MYDLLIAGSVGHHAPQLPEPLKPYLILLDHPAGLPVCWACQAALLPKSLLDHLRKRHQLPVGLRGDVRSLVVTLPSLDFDDVPTSRDGSAPLAALRVVNAFQCKRCPFIRRDLTDVRKHINQEHNIPRLVTTTKYKRNAGLVVVGLSTSELLYRKRGQYGKNPPAFGVFMKRLRA